MVKNFEGFFFSSVIGLRGFFFMYSSFTLRTCERCYAEGLPLPPVGKMLRVTLFLDDPFYRLLPCYCPSHISLTMNSIRELFVLRRKWYTHDTRTLLVHVWRKTANIDRCIKASSLLPVHTSTYRRIPWISSLAHLHLRMMIDPSYERQRLVLQEQVRFDKTRYIRGTYCHMCTDR